jgi:hypothetical protein
MGMTATSFTRTARAKSIPAAASHGARRGARRYTAIAAMSAAFINGSRRMVRPMFATSSIPAVYDDIASRPASREPVSLRVSA